MKSIEVGNKTLNISTDVLGLGKNKQGAIIDSGTTLAYLPREIYDPLLIEVSDVHTIMMCLIVARSFLLISTGTFHQIFADHSDMKIYTLEDQYTCFRYSDR